MANTPLPQPTPAGVGHAVCDELDATVTLAAVEGTLVERRAAEARDLALAGHWADLHASDPRQGPNGRRRWEGQDRLVQVAGDGAPWVQELCLPELAIARQVHPLAVRRLVADVLDLRHRLPHTWAAVQDLVVEPWVARRVATMTRELGEHAARRVDDALAECLTTLTPGRLFEIVQAKVIQADPQRHSASLEAEKHKRYVTLSRTDEVGLRHVVARVRAGDAAWIAATVDRVADILRPRFPEDTTKDELRSEAFGWLARPAELLQLLLDGVPDPTFDQADLADAIRSIDPKKLRPQAVLYVHLHEEAVRADLGLARIEDIGPLLSSQIPEWLGHAHVTVKPVVDVAEQVAADAYEAPESLRQRMHLRTPGDSFPHANQVTRRLDHDHVVPYAPDGPPGQTGDHNAQPLGRTGHRAKTQLGYRVRQLRPGRYVWRTPHGRYRLVDHHGTHVLPEDVGSGLMSHDPVDRAVAEMTRQVRLTGRARTPAPPR